ncbi:TetR family transcriptional regulator [Aquincola tertiaricarbonis]|uniref:TetR family transcriptional regulator n=1 Tax=Aquincola tertiaricarbonis TaxID=391953 RepID=A0ABY4S1L2_AQUTE|nr:TetR family transcriptional regulator [Aquincola tertiaricarbonis]URI07328.1 TetR family transcriptional regulator [Aquincola tertiaricarbonis]
MSNSRTTRAQAAQATTDRLIVVAHRAFAEHGFADVSLDALAAEAGVTRGALHHHFGNKAGLFEAVLRRIDAEIGGEIQAVWEATPDDWEGFRACFHAYLDAVLRPDRSRILFQDAPAVLGMKAVDILMESGFGDMLAELQGLIDRRRISTPDAEALAHLLNGATINLAFWAAEGPSTERRRERAHATLASVLDGLTQAR